jgi:sugar phosphate isomerase/epimerase
MKHQSSRRNFLKTTTIAALAFATTSFEFKKYTPLLSFSTLGCPDWSFDTIVNFAAANNYKGIEIRGIKRELDLSKCTEFNSKENIQASLKLVQSKGLKFVDLGSSAEMHHADETEKQKNIDEAKRFIDLAQQLECPYIRVFPNNFPKEQEHDATIETIAKNLSELGDYAKATNVTVLMETHGDLVHSDDVQKIMQSVQKPHVGLVWDIVNMWSITKEQPAVVYEKLKNYIHHTHIKDLKMVDGKEHYTLVGKGESPIFEAIDILAKNNYKGYYSFEWEKMWHPEIEDSETALSDYPKAMMQHFNS